VEKATIQAAPKVQTPHHVLESLKHREFLNVQQVCKLLGCSKQTVYRLIHSGRLKAVNLACKKTTIKRAALDNLFV
jgi:excisionase family DNA binding protein